MSNQKIKVEYYHTVELLRSHLEEIISKGGKISGVSCLKWESFAGNNYKALIVYEETNINKLLQCLIQYGGEIVSSSSLDAENINQARASERMWVDENGYGFIWMPPAKFPQTEDEVELFEKFFPLPIKIPEDLTYENLLKRAEEIKQRKNN